MEELKKKKPGQWYSSLKKMTSYDQMKDDQLVVDEISHLPYQEQAEIIAEQFASIQNEYETIQKMTSLYQVLNTTRSSNSSHLRFGLH